MGHLERWSSDGWAKCRATRRCWKGPTELRTAIPWRPAAATAHKDLWGTDPIASTG